MILTKGNILYSPWGYEQTNISFYEVVKSTNKSVWLQKIKTKRIKEAGFMSEYVMPDRNDKIGNIFRKKINFYLGEISIDINSYESAHLWDGEAKLQTYYA